MRILTFTSITVKGETRQNSSHTALTLLPSQETSLLGMPSGTLALASFHAWQ